MSEQFLEVPLSSIAYSKDFNSRVTYARVKELAEDIKRSGQINPVIVVAGDKPNTFKLIAGHRRAMALDLLKAKTIKVLVRPPVKDEREAFLINVDENVSRDDLTTFEVAQMLRRMREEYKLSDDQIRTAMSASKGGYSTTHINNLIRLTKTLAPKILDAWREEHGAISLLKLLNWASLSHDEQLEEFDRAAANKPSDGSRGESSSSSSSDDSKKPPRVMNRDQIEIALASVREAVKAGQKGAEFIEVALKFVLRRKDAIALKVGDVVFFDPRDAEREAEELKAKEFAAKVKAKEEEKAKAQAEKAEATRKAAEERAAKIVADAEAKAKAIASGEKPKTKPRKAKKDKAAGVDKSAN